MPEPAPTPDLVAALVAKAHHVWRETLRIHRRAPETRLASSLSAVEIFVTLYYGGLVRTNPANPFDPERDRCIISKGHGSICMYPILADLGFFPAAELERVCQAGSFLGGIPDPVIPGYETVNGSLGHGLGVGAGIALALSRKASTRSVFVVCGDGELHEGANWEAAMFASQHRLDHLNLIVDDNRISMLGRTDDIVTLSPLRDRLASFGWDCVEVDGHDVAALLAALRDLKARHAGQPKALIARTLKGRGVPGLEDMPLSHVMNPPPAQIDAILAAPEGGGDA
ncbi:MAG: transketolase [Rhodocyclaceae bacterium]|nr:transketolase [Rhodocyclaceae bacterium]MCL4757179.1 transketolase [Rhodocyclaceae bacterium]